MPGYKAYAKTRKEIMLNSSSKKWLAKALLLMIASIYL
jgi:hypothetical protein